MMRLIDFIYWPPLLIAAILSLKSFRLSWPPPYKYFSILLWVMLFIEIATFNWSLWLHKAGKWSYMQDNTWIYNLSLIPQYVLLMIFYQKIFNNKMFSKQVKVLIAVFTFAAFANMFFLQGMFRLNSYTMITGNLITLFFAIKYFDKALQTKKYTPLEKIPLTWISLGVLINHSANIPNILGIAYPDLFPYKWAMAFYYLSLFVNCLMFSLFIIAYRCKPLQHN